MGIEAKVNISRHEWTGWVKEQPEATKESLSVNEGDSISLRGMFEGDEYKLKVARVDNESIKLEPEGKAPAPVGSLSGKIGATELKVGESLKAGTPTTDQGVTWEITLEGLEDKS